MVQQADPLQAVFPLLAGQDVLPLSRELEICSSGEQIPSTATDDWQLKLHLVWRLAHVALSLVTHFFLVLFSELLSWEPVVPAKLRMLVSGAIATAGLAW
ncbi:hypothetical protein KR038_008698 [Drosophila bunnanda]|nr:hypothetical protein KR038_008698 [Drosophila bunnanda]